MAYQLPQLPYAYNALEPYIDAATVEIHHTKHHQNYVNNVNKAIEGRTDLETKTIEDLLKDLNAIPEDIRQAVRNNGGGHANHALYWSVLGPQKGGEPSGELAEAIKKAFGSFETFKEKFETAAKKQFGSGWAWLIADRSGALDVVSTSNQDTPLSDGKVPLLTVDVWEHAYYLKYQNRRPEYVSAFWNIINWDAVAERYKPVQ